MGVIHRISISAEKSKKKKNIDHATVTAGAGIEGDVHGNLTPNKAAAKLKACEKEKQ